MLKEFREFAARGNVIDLAVGVIIGAAFGKIVTSLVNDLLMPPIGMALGRVNFADLFIALDGSSYPSVEAAKAAGAPTINYGTLPEHHPRVRHRRLRGVPARPADQPPAETGAGARRRGARLPVLPVADSAQGDALRAVHVSRAAGRRLIAVRRSRRILS